ncbi:MAG: sodium:alanine symporter family protein [Chlamydiota bacterium]|nr:sodium:alanine symporter family protein [Chlamydiota bacterium]
MEDVNSILLGVKELLWGPPLLALLLGVGVYLTFLLKGVQFSYMGYALKQVLSKTKSNAKGDISHFEALMTSLAGAIGTGAIVGVASALAVGGLGALFWMWVTAFLGMATKYAESLLAVKYRVKDKRGEMIGGPMEYIERGLNMRWMAILFALFGSVAAVSTGNLVQINSIVEAVETVWSINPWVAGGVVAVVTGFVIVGGVRSIGHVAGVFVPLMALFYLIGGMLIVGLNLSSVPKALYLIVKSAFTGQAAFGGFAGSSLMMALQMGVSRSIFSNEAGLGISSISAAAAKTDSPGRQAMITMTGALLSTVIVCTITGLVIAVSEVLGTTNGSGVMLNGAPLAIAAFESTLVGGGYIVTFGLVLFAFSTILAWAYYGEKCFEYIFGEKAVIPYRILFTLIIIPGAVMKMETVWYIADISNALMVVPNLIALVLSSKVIQLETKKFLEVAKKEIEQQKNI